MAIKSLSDIVNSAISFITSRKPNIATVTGSVVRDVVIESPAQEFSNLYQELSHTQQLQSVAYASNLSVDELNALGANYNMTRLPGTVATGTITFRVRNFSFSSSMVVIPVGTIISTSATTAQSVASFSTTVSAIFYPVLAPSYFNSNSGLYEQTVSIACQSIGTSGNVPAGTITNLVSAISGIDSIINNVSTTGGTTIENNASFANRIRIKLSGNSVGTSNGIISAMKLNSNVQDAIVVTANDPEMLRSQFGGEVDVYILGNVLSTTSDLQLYQTAGPQSFVLEHEPAVSVGSVTGIVSGSPYTFIPGTDYTFTIDVSQLFGGSTKAESYITFLLTGTKPDDSTQITIGYTYDVLMETLQNNLNNDSAHIVASDILVRSANEAVIGIDADITIFSGYVATDVTLAVQSALSVFISTLGLGKSINRSDVIAVIEGVAGVDAVNVDTLVLSKNTVPIPSIQQKLTIFKTEYGVTGTLVITPA